jgi:ribulose-bisphosphate carboxylase large chain
MKNRLPTHDPTSDAERWFDAVYRVRASAGDVDQRAQAIALEQSVEVPLAAVTDRRVREDVVGRVARVVACGDAFEVTIRLAVETAGTDAGQLLNMLFGNSSMQDDVTLIDAHFAPGLTAAFGGPRFGIAGIRDLVGVHGRPLTCAALKPQGLTAGQLAAIAETFARAGIDVIKDDHGLADQAAAPFADRVGAVQGAVDRANDVTGHRCVYAPSLTGNLDQMRARRAIAACHGVRMFLLAPMISGVSTLSALAREASAPLIAHPSLSGVARIAPPLLLGKLFRLFGADASIFPNAGGRFGYSLDTCAQIVAAAREPWHGLLPALPVPGGGMSVERVPEMRSIFGDDAMLLIGGSLLMPQEPLLARSRQFVEAVAQGMH